MTLPPKTITVKCPQCQQVYIDWHTPAVGNSTDFKPTTVCSQCGHRSTLEDLTEQDGTWQQKATPQSN